MMKKRCKQLAGSVLIVLMVLPVVYIIANSMMSKEEILRYYRMGKEQFSGIHLIPEHVTLAQYAQAFFRSPSFLYMFWNSVIYTLPVVAGQFLLSVPAAYAFAKLPFKGRDGLFFACVVLLILPVQVTIVPGYIVTSRLGLLDHRLSVILPGIFLSFGLCLLRQSMRYIPDEQLDAARLEGAKEHAVLLHIVLPQVKSAASILCILTFIDCWNMVEQPLIYLNSPEKQPLSIYLNTIWEENMGIAFACGTIFAVPVVLLYMYVCRDIIGADQGGNRHEENSH